MPFQDTLERIEAVLARSPRVPLTGRVLVDSEALHAAVQELRRGGQDDDLDLYIRDIAGALDDLRRGEAPPPVTAAATASVQPILEAAEATAARVRAEAENDARRMVEAAEREVAARRAETAERVAAELRRVDQATARIDGLLDDASRDAQALVESLRVQSGGLAQHLGGMLAELDAVAEYQRALAADPDEDELLGTELGDELARAEADEDVELREAALEPPPL